jgi:hypothetical protein
VPTHLIFLALGVRGAGEIQDPFGDGGLTGIDMGENADIAQAGQRAVLLTVVKVCTHGPMAFRMIRIGTARFADEAACGQAMRHTPAAAQNAAACRTGLVSSSRTGADRAAGT